VYRYRVKVIVELREYFLRKQREEEERIKQVKLAEIKRMYDAAFSIQRMARAHMVRFMEMTLLYKLFWYIWFKGVEHWTFSPLVTPCGPLLRFACFCGSRASCGLNGTRTKRRSR
jgi:hypothetical protein